MSNSSATAYLLWAILSSLFLIFLVYHLWHYDRFRCLRWNAGRQPGAFKRVMTYTYVATLPLLVFYGVAMTVLKFKEGVTVYPNGQTGPKLATFWSRSHRIWLLPCLFVLSGGWALEIVTHLEELTFWLFMLHQGPSKRDWFDSWEVRVWYIGSMAAIIGLPLTVLITRKELLVCEAWVFFAGSSVSFITTICSLYVLARFPIFIRHVKAEGAEPDVVVRLSTFYSLNVVRVVFRFVFTVPILVLGIDGIHGTHPINASLFWGDFLLIMGGIGCFISSAITLLIFFPRSMSREAGYQSAAQFTEPKESRPTSLHFPTSRPESYRQHDFLRQSFSHPGSQRSPTSPTAPYAAGLSFSYPERTQDQECDIPLYESDDPRKARFADHIEHINDNEADMPWSESSHASHNMGSHHRQSMQSTSRRHSHPDLHPYVMNFTSPIDLFDGPDDGHTYTHRGVA